MLVGRIYRSNLKDLPSFKALLIKYNYILHKRKKIYLKIYLYLLDIKETRVTDTLFKNIINKEKLKVI